MQATHLASTPGFREGYRARGIRGLAWGRLGETKRSRTLTTRRLPTSLFLTPLATRTPLPRHCHLREEKGTSRGCSSRFSEGEGRAGGGASAVRGGREAGLAPGAGPRRRALRESGARGGVDRARAARS